MNIAFAVSTVLLLFCPQPPKMSRRWPDGQGGFVRGDIILIRPSEIVIRTGAKPKRYLSIPKTSLSETDKKQLKRLGGDALDPFENLSAELRLIANIQDSRTLLDAASLFRNKDIAYTLTTFEAYLNACQSNQRLSGSKLWYLATIIFEHPQPLYPDFWSENMELVTPRWPKPKHDIPIVAGTPFWIQAKFGHSGPIWPGASGLLGWIRDHARLRTKWIHPKAPPTESIKLLNNDSKQCRQQAWRLVSHLFDENWNMVFAMKIDDERWERLEAMVESLAVEWDVESQSFQATKEAVIPDAPEDWLPTDFIGSDR